MRHVNGLAGEQPRDGERAVALALSEVREIVKRLFAQQDVLDACIRRDLGYIVTVLNEHGVTQGQIAQLTGITQGRLSEWANHRRAPQASSTFESFAEGLGAPPTARRLLGLSPRPSAGVGPSAPPAAQGRVTRPEAPSPAATRPVSPRPTSIPMIGLADLRRLDAAVRDQLDEVMAVLEVEQGRKSTGAVVRRRAWKNLVFAGGPGSGKSHAAVAVGQAYRKLEVLTSGHVIEAAAAELTGDRPGETATLLAEAIKPAGGGILLINAAHDWQRLPDRGQQVLGHLYRQLTVYRKERGDELAVILSGRAEPLRKLLQANPPLAARFRAVIEFPGFGPAQLSVIFGTLGRRGGAEADRRSGEKGGRGPRRGRRRSAVRQRPPCGPAAEPGRRASGATRGQRIITRAGPGHAQHDHR
jgi:transcriptional regulator with XRE-family HTH domain